VILIGTLLSIGICAYAEEGSAKTTQRKSGRTQEASEKRTVASEAGLNSKSEEKKDAEEASDPTRCPQGQKFSYLYGECVQANRKLKIH
jgi:hypothetical protein